MLVHLRSKQLQKNIFIFLSIVIIPGFIAWGTVSFVSAQRRAAVMEISGQKIFPENLEEYKKEVVMGQFMLYGKNFYEHLDDNLINAMAIERLLLIKKAQKEKLAVSDAEVVQHIKTLFSINDTFKQAAYDNFLKMLFTVPRLRYTSEKFEDFLRHELLINKLRETIFKDITVDDAEARTLFLEENEQIQMRFAYLPFEAYEKDITPKPQEIEQRYTHTKERYTIPPKVGIQSLLIPTRSGNDTTQTVDAASVRKALRKAKNSLEMTGQQFKQTPTTETIALQDEISNAGFYPEINSRIFSAEDNTLIGPFQIKEGFLMIKKLRSLPQHIPSLEEVSSEIKADLIREQAQAKAAKDATEILELLKKGAPVQEISVKYPKAVVKESGYVSYTTKEPLFGTFTFNKTLADEFIGLKKNETTPTPVSYDSKGLIAARVLDKKTAKDFKDEKDTYVQKILLQKKMLAYVMFLQQIGTEMKVKVFAPTT